MDETKPGGLSTAALADQRNQYNLLLEQFNRCRQEYDALKLRTDSAAVIAQAEIEFLRTQLAAARRPWWKRWRA